MMGLVIFLLIIVISIGAKGYSNYIILVTLKLGGVMKLSFGSYFVSVQPESIIYRLICRGS